MKKVLLSTLRIVRNVLIAIALLVLFGLWVLRTDWAQRRLLPYVTEVLKDQLGVPVEIGHLDLDLPAQVVVRDAVMRDQQGQKMFAAQEVRVSLMSFSLWDLLFRSSEPKRLRISRLQLIQPEAHLYRRRQDSSMNLDFLRGSNDTTSGPPLALDLEVPEIWIRGGIFSYVDSTKSDTVLAERGRVNFANLYVRRINGDFSFHLLPDQTMQAGIRRFTATEEYAMLYLNELATDAEIQPSADSTGRLRIGLENTRLRAGRTRLDFDGELRDARPDSVVSGFTPAFRADFRPSVFDFSTLNYLLRQPLPMRDPVRLRGLVMGDLEQIRSDSLHIGLYERTELHLGVELAEYTDADALRYNLDIYEGQVQFEELGRFLPGIDIPLAGLARLRGEVIADLNLLRTRNLVVDYGEQTDLLVRARLYDYTKGDDLFMDIRFKDSHLAFREVRALLPSMQLPGELDQVGRTEINGKFMGGISQFLLDAQLVSPMGEVDANLQLTLPPKVPDLAYDGWLKTRNVNLLPLQADLGFALPRLNFDGKVRGQGTEFGTMNADIDGTFTDTEFEGYVFDLVQTDTIKIRGSTIDGEINLQDAEGDARLQFTVLLTDSVREVELEGGVENIDLAHYAILPDDSVLFTSRVSVAARGDSVEEFTGRVELLNMALVRQRTPDSLYLSDFLIDSRLSERHEHNITLESSLFHMGLRGDFNYGKAWALTQRLTKEIGLYIQNNDTAIANYYAQKILEPADVRMWDTIRTKHELNDLLAFFRAPVYVMPNTEAIFYLEHGITDMVDVKISSDSLGFSSASLIGNTVTLNVIKDGSMNELLLSADANSDTVAIGSNLRFEDVILRPEGDNRKLDIYLVASQSELGNTYRVQSQTEFQKGGVVTTKVLPAVSELKVKGKVWKFAEGNSIKRTFGTLSPSQLTEGMDSVISRYRIQNLNLSNSGQTIRINGEVSKDITQGLNVQLADVRIHSLLEILEQPGDYDGRISRGRVTGINLLGKRPTLGWNLEVEDFKYQPGDSIGVRFRGGWPQDSRGEIMGLELEAGHWGKDSLVVKGDYNVVRDSLDLTAEPSSVLLSWTEPLVTGVLSDMQGRVKLNSFTVRGPLTQPNMQGKLHLVDAGFKADYLNNVFRLSNDTIEFNNEEINIKGLAVRDTFGGTAEIDGQLRLEDGDFIADIHLFPIKKLTVLDTRKGQNPDFYGHVVLEGDSARVTGPVTKPLLEAWVNTGDSCWLDIPLSDYTSASRLDFVNFVRENEGRVDSAKMDLGGFQLRLLVNARENAKVRMIFDEKTGDIIEARGSGAISMDINEDGDFLMSGPYTVSKGQYLFTAENIINKKFTVENGGTIVWSGDPYDAQVNLEALYAVTADVTALIPTATSKVPIDIVMRMTGSLMQPEINLDLRPQSDVSSATGLDSYFRSIQYDQQELNKQVVSLMLFGRFTGQSTGSNNVAGAGVTSSISELISNQVNYWISQAFDNANLGLEVNTNEFQDVELALRASLFNNKVTVERDGALVSNNNSGFSIGDVSVQVKVLPASDSARANPQAGQLIVEIFNREDITLNTANNVSRGTGLFYKKDFDRFSDLFGKREKTTSRRGKRSEVEVEE
ncbi:MAG: translocation/assembly module TamB domain-containing protein [Bacteroidota bacterium]